MRNSILIVFIFFAIPFLASAAWVMPNGRVFAEYITPSGYSIWQEVIGTITTTAHADELPLETQIRNYIITMAQFYGANPDQMVAVAECESQLRPDAVGDHGKAINIFQWWASSWKKYNEIYGTNLDRNSWLDQAKMSAKVFADGGEDNWWNCVRFVRYGTWDKNKWRP